MRSTGGKHQHLALIGILCNEYKPPNLSELKQGIKAFWESLTPEICSRYIGHLKKSNSKGCRSQCRTIWLLILSFLLIQFSMSVHVCYLLYCDYYQWWVGITRAFEQVFFRYLYWYEKQDHNIISVCLGLYYLVSLMCLIGISISIRVVLTRALCQFHGSVPGLRFGI